MNTTTRTTTSTSRALSTFSRTFGFLALGAALLCGACDQGEYEDEYLEDEMAMEDEDVDASELIEASVIVREVSFNPELQQAAIDFDAIDEGDAFADDCNLCVLTKTGAVCTLQACVDPEDEANRDKELASCRDGEYLEGDMWQESCNMCTCTSEGAACTRKACDPESLPY